MSHQRVHADESNGCVGDPIAMMSNIIASLYPFHCAGMNPSSGLANDIFAEITDSLPGHLIHPCTSPEPLAPRSLSKKAYQSDAVLVTPNPAKDYITIQTEFPMFEVRLFDMANREVLKANSFENTLQLTVQNLKPGVYLLNVLYGNMSKSMKIVINP